MNKKSILIIIIVSISIAFICGSLGAYAILNSNVINNTVDNVITTISKNTEVENTISYSVNKIYNATVVIEGYNNGNLISTGSGFTYKIKGTKAFVMTNYHVISGATEIKVLFNNETEAIANVIGGESYSDIAVLSVEASKILQLASLGNTDDLKVGDTLFAIGAPEGSIFKGSVTKGVLSGKDRLVAISTSNNQTSDYYMKVLQTDTAINPGNSGGPLCNINGEVIGITNMKLVDSSVEGMGFAIPIEDALLYASALETGNKVKRPYMGLSILDIADSFYLWQQGITIDANIKSGVVVTNVEKLSPAYISGLKKGDVILQINNEKIESVAKFRYILYKYKSGDKIKVTYIRDNQTKEVTIKLTNSK